MFTAFRLGVQTATLSTVSLNLEVLLNYHPFSSYTTTYQGVGINDSNVRTNLERMISNIESLIPEIRNRPHSEAATAVGFFGHNSPIEDSPYIITSPPNTEWYYEAETGGMPIVNNDYKAAALAACKELAKVSNIGSSDALVCYSLRVDFEDLGGSTHSITKTKVHTILGGCVTSSGNATWPDTSSTTGSDSGSGDSSTSSDSGDSGDTGADQSSCGGSSYENVQDCQSSCTNGSCQSQGSCFFCCTDHSFACNDCQPPDTCQENPGAQGCWECVLGSGCVYDSDCGQGETCVNNQCQGPSDSGDQGSPGGGDSAGGDGGGDTGGNCWANNTDCSNNCSGNCAFNPNDGCYICESGDSGGDSGGTCNDIVTCEAGCSGSCIPSTIGSLTCYVCQGSSL